MQILKNIYTLSTQINRSVYIKKNDYFTVISSTFTDVHEYKDISVGVPGLQT